VIRDSLRLRLALSGLVLLIVSLAAAQVGLSILFNRHAERAIAADLLDLSDYLAATTKADGNGRLSLSEPPADPAYDRPYSGRYWIVTAGDQTWNSRSLWDFTLVLPEALPPGQSALITIPGPQDTALLALDRTLIRQTAQGESPLRITTALERGRLDTARATFESEMLPWIAAFGVLVLLAGWLQIRVGLAPLSSLAERLQSLTAGKMDRIGLGVPEEIAPLASQIDQLLDARAEEIGRSRRRAADLAHGLKTPLQALLGDAARLRETGRQVEAESIETIVTSIRQQVDRELARATLVGEQAGTQADVTRVLQGVVRVIQRTPDGARLSWLIPEGPALFARIDSTDLTEALGALIENAAKHATRTIGIDARQTEDRVLITIADDGPGLPENQIARLRRRGQRLDTSGDGNGFGLSIADEIASRAQGSLDIRNRTPGLEVVLDLPAAALT
jgi:signal transduction histidine kinase